MPVQDRFKVSKAETPGNVYKKYEKNSNTPTDDGVTEKLLPNSQDASLQSTVEAGMIYFFIIIYY